MHNVCVFVGIRVPTHTYTHKPRVTNAPSFFGVDAWVLLSAFLPHLSHFFFICTHTCIHTFTHTYAEGLLRAFCDELKTQWCPHARTRTATPVASAASVEEEEEEAFLRSLDGVVVYRDGVGRSQFNAVHCEELPQVAQVA